MKTARVALIFLSVSSATPVLAAPTEGAAKVPMTVRIKQAWKNLWLGKKLGSAPKAAETATEKETVSDKLVVKPSTDRAEVVREPSPVTVQSAVTIKEVAKPVEVVTTPVEKPKDIEHRPSLGIGAGRDRSFGSSSLSFGGEREYKWTAPPRQKLPYEQMAADKVAHVDRILKQGHRPSQADFESLLRNMFGDKLPAQNPFGTASHVDQSSSEIVDMIAQLERAYPGGTYLPLGRDAVAIADTLHAFYKSIGHPERARRLDMSGTSLPHYRNASEDTYEKDAPVIHGFLKAQGLDLDKLDAKHPFVMVDITSFNPTSQSTQLMRSVYRTWSNMGRDPKELADKVAFVGLPMGGARYSISEIGDLAGTKAKLKSTITRNGPADILYLGGRLHQLTYTRFWHQDFLRFEQEGGKVVSRPGTPTSNEQKLDVLAEMFEIHKMMSSGEMLQRVQAVASRKYGFEYSKDGVAKVSAQLAKIEPAKTETPAGPTGFVGAVHSTLGNAPTVTNAVHFLQDIAGMRARKTMTSKQFREALLAMDKYVPIRQNAELEGALQGIFARNPGFREDMAKQLTKVSIKLGPPTKATQLKSDREERSAPTTPRSLRVEKLAHPTAVLELPGEDYKENAAYGGTRDWVTLPAAKTGAKVHKLIWFHGAGQIPNNLIVRRLSRAFAAVGTSIEITSVEYEGGDMHKIEKLIADSPEPVLIGGHSAGGGVADMIASRANPKIKAAILLNAVSNGAGIQVPTLLLKGSEDGAAYSSNPKVKAVQVMNGDHSMRFSDPSSRALGKDEMNRSHNTWELNKLIAAEIHGFVESL